MTKFLGRFLLIVIGAILLSGCMNKPYIDKSTTINPKDYVVDDFLPDNENIDCPAYRDLRVDENFGYCIYYDNATVVAEMEKLGLRLEYELRPFYEWGNWFSVRKNSSNYFDLSSYSGVKVRLRNQIQGNALFRITLIDVDPNSVPYTSDEMWWCNMENVPTATDQWQIVVCPFKSFILSSGFGARKNGGRLDLVHIAAYEISIISKPDEIVTGGIELNSFAVYK